MTRFKDEKQTRRNNRILESIWNKLSSEKRKLVEMKMLDWEKFQFDSQSLIRNNGKTGKSILWYHDYGLELVDEKTFEIHKKA